VDSPYDFFDLQRHRQERIMRLAYAALAAWLIGNSSPLLAQTPPTTPAGPVSLLVPYPAGGASDITARIFSEPLSQELGTPVIVENLGGATGGVAVQKMLNAPANGRMLYQGSQNELILPPLTVKGTRYNVSDFEIVHPITTTRLVLVVRKGLPVKNLEELVTLARERSASDPLACGIPGIGSLYHLIPDSMAKKAAVSLNFIPYKGSAPLMQDLLGERIDFTIMAFSTTMMSFVQDGRYRILANLSKDKPRELAHLQSLSDLPVFGNMDYASNAAYYVKKGTPMAVRQSLNAAIAKVVQRPTVIQALEGDGRRVPAQTSVAEAEHFYAREIAAYDEMVKVTGFKPVD